jgi:hypothetical protein
MVHQPRSTFRSPDRARDLDQRELKERARRMRWLAEMTVDAAARTELMGYADELDQRAHDAADHASDPTPTATVYSQSPAPR